MELAINPRFLERSIEPSLMGPDMARFLENVDVTFLDGRMRRGGVYTTTDYCNTDSISASAKLLSFFVAERWDGSPILFVHDLTKIRMGRQLFAQSTDVFASSDDSAYFTSGTTFQESFNEDTTSTADPGL